MPTAKAPKARRYAPRGPAQPSRGLTTVAALTEAIRYTVVTQA
ncbi:Uncharacterised protein [Mycobacteroides abscessus subsp. abscessus]|nr:Uncharacterised protein [Mycobacteroides abscessus subsp. abscessus]